MIDSHMIVRLFGTKFTEFWKLSRALEIWDITASDDHSVVGFLTGI